MLRHISYNMIVYITPYPVYISESLGPFRLPTDVFRNANPAVFNSHFSVDSLCLFLLSILSNPNK